MKRAINSTGLIPAETQGREKRALKVGYLVVGYYQEGVLCTELAMTRTEPIYKTGQ